MMPLLFCATAGLTTPSQRHLIYRRNELNAIHMPFLQMIVVSHKQIDSHAGRTGQLHGVRSAQGMVLPQ